MFNKAKVWGLLTALLLPAVNVAEAEQAPLRIAMTLADIPLTDGAPDQGTEESGSSATPSTTRLSAGTSRTPINRRA